MIKKLLESSHFMSRYAAYSDNQYLFQEDICSKNVFNGLWFLARQYDKILTKSSTTGIPQIQS